MRLSKVLPVNYLAGARAFPSSSPSPRLLTRASQAQVVDGELGRVAWGRDQVGFHDRQTISLRRSALGCAKASSASVQLNRKAHHLAGHASSQDVFEATARRAARSRCMYLHVRPPILVRGAANTGSTCADVAWFGADNRPSRAGARSFIETAAPYRRPFPSTRAILSKYPGSLGGVRRFVKREFLRNSRFALERSLSVAGRKRGCGRA